MQKLWIRIKCPSLLKGQTDVLNKLLFTVKFV